VRQKQGIRTNASYRTRSTSPSDDAIEPLSDAVTPSDEILRMQRALMAARLEIVELKKKNRAARNSLANRTRMLRSRSFIKGYAYFERDVLDITGRLTSRLLGVISDMDFALECRADIARIDDDVQTLHKIEKERFKLKTAREATARESRSVAQLFESMGGAYAAVDKWAQDLPTTPIEHEQKSADETAYNTALTSLARLWEDTSARCDWIVDEAERWQIYLGDFEKGAHTS
jgi:hypothetical protein